MDFALSEEQSLLQASAERFISDNYNFEARRALASQADGFSRNHWAQFAELGWLALPISEEAGGLGGSAVDVMVLMEQFGQGLVLEPYLPTVLLAGRLLDKLGNDQQKERYLKPLIEGGRLGAFAYTEEQARYTLSDVVCSARQDEGAWIVSGKKSVVLHAEAADFLIVLARTSGDQMDQEGLGCFLVDKETPGLVVHNYQTMDGGRAAEVQLDNVKVQSNALLGDAVGAYAYIEEAIDYATAAICAEAVGIMEKATDATRDYLLQRKQFGMPIAAFQSLQHRLADMVIATEQARSMAYMANIRMSEDRSSRSIAVSSAKAEIGRLGKFVLANAVQLHGGMGVSEELNIGTYFKRFHAIDALFGNRDYQLKRYQNLAA